MLCEKMDRNNIEITQKYVEKELVYAEKYQKILDNWCDEIGGLLHPFHQKSPNLLETIRVALTDSFVISMAKIFARSNEAGLWKLIQLASEIEDNFLQLKLERKPDFVKSNCEEKRKVFLSNKEMYIAKIKEIRNELKPLRNIERVHNLPWYDDATKIAWPKLKGWLYLAKKIYAEILESIVETYPLNDLVPEEFDRQIADNVNWINNISV